MRPVDELEPSSELLEPLPRRSRLWPEVLVVRGVVGEREVLLDRALAKGVLREKRGCLLVTEANPSVSPRECLRGKPCPVIMLR